MRRPRRGRNRISAVTNARSATLLRALLRTFLRSILLSGLLLGGGAPRAEATPASNAAYAEGQTLAGAKRYAEAAEKFEAVVAADPKNATAWYQLAAARRKSARCDRAVVAYRHYAELAPTEPEPYYGLGLCLRDTGDGPGALQALKHYVTIEKRPSSQKWLEHAQSVIAELSAAPAAAAAKDRAPTAAVAKASAASPGNAAYVEAQALRDRGRIDEAIVKFKQAIAADPRLTPARAALGELLLKIRRDDEAIEVFRVTVDKNPGYPLAWYDLAFAFRAKGRMTEAVDAYERYIKLRPADPDPYYGLGRALQNLGRKAAARQAYETYVAMEKHPTEKRWIESAQTQLQALGTGP